ncbi:MAG: DUF885 family protein, partial [Saprospiraceae bacterium]|nr:DUF885 family protein [Saprospiraceae bacterium]
MKNTTLFLALLFLLSCQNPKQTKDASQELNDFITIFNSDENQGVNDLSATSFQAELNKTEELLKQLNAIDTSQLSGDDLIDWKFAHSILSGRKIEQESIQSWKRDPRDYMSFRALSNIINRPGITESKVDNITERLKMIPVQLKNGAAQLEFYIPRFQELGLFMAENSRALFDKELPDFIAIIDKNNQEELNKLNTEAKTALESYIDFLKNELPKRQKGDFPIGETTYNQMLTQQYLLDYDAESLWNYGWERFEATVKELEEVAARIDATKTWQELAQEIKNDYPHPDSMIQAHQYWVNRSKQHIIKNDLMPIPWQERVNVVPRAEYLRKTSYYGNFSIARGKDADSTFTSQWMINPFEYQWDEKTKQEYLVEHDWGVIIVTAPHETYGGHHVQGLYQMHHPRPLRKNNGISIFSEGWGLYNEQLMQETGFFPNERIHLRQLQLRLWRNARVIYDVGMHSGRMSYEEAV